MLKVVIGIFTLSLAFGAYAVSVHFQECEAQGRYYVEEVFLNVPCKTQPCWFPLKKQTNITVIFKSSNTVALDLRSEVYLKVVNSRKNIETLPYSCPKNVCPVNPMEKKTYSIIVKPNFHMDPIKGNLHWELYNQKSEKLFWVYIPVIVYDPETHHPGYLMSD